MGSVNLSPHIGIVHIDDNVSIGSNCSIDKAKIDVTYIGKNSMIDNLVHIAHNVIIGDNACIAAQTGIAGSVKIGKNLICGGQSAFAGHITIGNNVLVAGKSGVTKNLKDNSSVAGFPATDINKWKKSIILNRKRNV
jgi:UDP-3-O-[3-hydroxymyristoyl] glucosamine N-acyltransferase